MRKDSLLVILNPRYLPECILSLEQIDAPKVWLKNFTELELEEVIPQVIKESDYENYIVVSDDVIASTDAFSAVASALDVAQVVTGYCNLDPHSPYCSLTKTPPAQPYGTVHTYDWYTLDEVYRLDALTIRTFHPSMAMTGMSAEMWGRFPWRCFGRNGKFGWAADLDLSIRLHEAGIPIFAPKKGFMYHTKPDWKLVDANMYDRRKLLVDIEPSEVKYDI